MKNFTYSLITLYFFILYYSSLLTTLQGIRKNVNKCLQTKQRIMCVICSTVADVNAKMEPRLHASGSVPNPASAMTMHANWFLNWPDRERPKQIRVRERERERDIESERKSTHQVAAAYQLQSLWGQQKPLSMQIESQSLSESCESCREQPPTHLKMQPHDDQEGAYADNLCCNN